MNRAEYVRARNSNGCDCRTAAEIITIAFVFYRRRLLGRALYCGTKTAVTFGPRHCYSRAVGAVISIDAKRFA